MSATIAAAKIPTTVVTGFLGAGKTTLIRHVLENAKGKRIALIVNEFGDLGVDGELLRGCGVENCADEDVIELSNGCICCTVADDFLPTMTMLLERRPAPDHIVIETSGLALPQPLIRAFNWPDIATRVTVDGVVAVVDGAALAEGRFAHDDAAIERQRQADDSLDHDTSLAELFEDQLAAADLVILNKTDLMSAPEAKAADIEARARPGVRVVAARHGVVDPALLLGLGVGAEADVEARAEIHHHHHDDDDDEDHDHEHDHGHDEFESVVVELPEIRRPDAFAAHLAAAIERLGLLRVKGFAAVEGKPMRLVAQAVGPRVQTYFDRPFQPGEARLTRLVAIGFHGLDAAAVKAALSEPADAAA